MTTNKIRISDAIGEVSVESTVPEKMKAMVTLAHGAGAGMHHRFMTALSAALAEHQIGSTRFNFPFTENGKKRPDFPAVAEKTIEVLLNETKNSFPDVPIFASGKSFGGRMSSQLLSKDTPSFVKGIVFYGFPLHPMGKPSTDRGAHLSSIKIPMLFLQGTRDSLATWDLVESVCDKLPSSTLEKIEGADHGFLIGKKECVPLLAEKTSAWIDVQLKK